MKAQIIHFDPYSLLVINASGKLKQLFVPIKMQVLSDNTWLKKDNWVMVDEIQPHLQHLLIFRIDSQWFPYHIFRLSVNF